MLACGLLEQAMHPIQFHCNVSSVTCSSEYCRSSNVEGFIIIIIIITIIITVTVIVNTTIIAAVNIFLSRLFT